MPDLAIPHLRVYQSDGHSPDADLVFESELLKRGEPALFIYHWRNTVLVLGRGQSSNTINRDACHTEGIDLLKRITGGTGVLHQHTLNLCLILPSTHPWTDSIVSLYHSFKTMVQDALSKQAVESRFNDPKNPPAKRTAICFESHTDDTLLLNGKKVFGSAQRRRRHAVLIHGTLLLDLNIPQQSRIFNVPNAHIKSIMCAVPQTFDVNTFSTYIISFLRRALGAPIVHCQYPPDQRIRHDTNPLA